MKKIFAACIAAMMMFLTTSAYCIAFESDIREIKIGASRAAVHDKIGSPNAVSNTGYKEIYSLGGKSIAVLCFMDDILLDGFIVIQ